MRQRRTLAALWTLAILAACSVPGGLVPDVRILSMDKVVHVALFFGFGVLWRCAGASKSTVALAGLGFAVFIEAWQHLLPLQRSADPFDALADLVGLGLALAVTKRGVSNSGGPTVSKQDTGALPVSSKET